MQIPVMTEELATRLERSEAGFWTTRLASVRRYEDNPLGVAIRQFGGATAFIVKALPHPMLNRFIGLTTGDEHVLEDVLIWYRDHGTSCRVDITPFACSQELLAHLAERGLYPSGSQTVLYGAPEAKAHSLSEGVTVQRLSPADREPFVNLPLRMSDISEAERAFWKDIITLLGSWAGVFIDRWDPKRVIVMRSLLQVLVLLLLLPGGVWLVCLAILCQALALLFLHPTMDVLMPRLVGEGELLSGRLGVERSSVRAPRHAVGLCRIGRPDPVAARVGHSTNRVRHSHGPISLADCVV